MGAQVLDQFHPLVRRWFERRFPAPTNAQAQAWPRIAAGEHVLVCAPTGSGKTLTAFLSAIDNLVTGRWPGGTVRALYLSPLKALNSDVRRNLLAPLDELRALFDSEGVAFPAIRVMTRSGDTPDDERRAMLRHPPEILITTPESLNLMLTGSRSRNLFAGLRAVILDEIHALAASKRGTYMMSAVERLGLFAGEFQRIALSATVKPAETVAAWMAGHQVSPLGPDARYQARPVTIVRATDPRPIALALRTPDIALPKGSNAADLWWQALASDLKAIVGKNRSTLIFANSRRTVEKVARLLNAGEPEPIAYSHHGSLSREIRLDVEDRMKQGSLRAVVATGSLELGIDIGSVEEVVLIGTPGSVAQSLQRIGRADHRVGGTSRASLFILHGLDGALAAAMHGMIKAGDIENTCPARNPLDVLAQVLLSMGCGATWDLDALYAFVRSIAAYHTLSRAHFDLVMAMLAGRYADAPIRELKPRAVIDKTRNTFTARKGTEFVLYQSGGTIPDRGYYHLRVADSKAVIGELDEEFVWERRLGDQFSLGTQAWRILAVTHNDVEVGPADPNGPMIPFWKAEEQNRSTQASFALLDFLDLCENNLDKSAFVEELSSRHGMDLPSAQGLVTFLRRQRDIAHAPLPGRGRILVECTKDPAAPSETSQVILHTFWGGRVNRPLAIALSEAWQRGQQSPLDCFASNDQIMLTLPDDFDPAALLKLVSSRNLDTLLRAGLEQTALFGARFRENAGRALLLPRGDARKRYPLWLNRLRAKKLLTTVSRFDDFPILLETWRDLLEDEFDLPTLRGLLDDIADGRIAIHTCRPPHPTPLADGIVFRQINCHMYLDDAPGGRAQSNLRDELVRDLVHDGGALPKVPLALVQLLESKLLRTHPDFRPSSREDVLLAVREIVLVFESVIEDWLGHLSTNEQAAPSDDPLVSLVRYRLPGATHWLVSDVEDLPRILALRGAGAEKSPDVRPLIPGSRSSLAQSLKARRFDGADDSATTLVADFLRNRGPLAVGEIADALGFDVSLLPLLLDELLETESIVAGHLVEGRDACLFCDAENVERLLRMHRSARKAATERSLPTRPIADLPHFLAEWHDLGRSPGGLDKLQATLDRLFGFPLPAESWEQAILPARLDPYYPSWIDSLFQSFGLAWMGCGKQRIAFAFADDLALFSDGDPGDASFASTLARALEQSSRGLGFVDLLTATGMESAALADGLWELAWRGRATSDNFETVRRGILSDFTAAPAAEKTGRGGFRRWERTRPYGGSWTIIPAPATRGALEQAELDKERARLVLARHGVVFRELLDHELPPLRWPRLFRALRLLELSDEIVSGHFFAGVPGIQFASHAAMARLSQTLPDSRIYFIHACDPASLCGLGLGEDPLPRRVPGNWMVYGGRQLLLVLQKNGRELNIFVEPGDARLPSALSIYRLLLGREFAPLSSVQLESVNGVSAAASPFADELRRFGFVNDYRGMSLWKR